MTQHNTLARGLTSVAAFVSFALFGAAAWAQEAPFVDLPTTATLDRQGIGNFAGVTAGFSIFDDDGPINAFGLRLDLYGQGMIQPNFGLYGRLPVSFLFIEDADNTSALGNVEVGGLFAHALQPGLSFLGRFGLSLPSAGDSFEDFLTNYINTFGRLTDLIDVAADTTTLRLSGSLFFEQEGFFARGDLGFDLVVNEPDGSDIDPLFRINGAVGFGNRNNAVMFELVTVGTTGDTASGTEKYVHTAAFTVVSRTQNIYASFIVPLDDDIRGDLWILAIGMHPRIGADKPRYGNYGGPSLD